MSRDAKRQIMDVRGYVFVSESFRSEAFEHIEESLDRLLDEVHVHNIENKKLVSTVLYTKVGKKAIIR